MHNHLLWQISLTMAGCSSCNELLGSSSPCCAPSLPVMGVAGVHVVVVTDWLLSLLQNYIPSYTRNKLTYVSITLVGLAEICVVDDVTHVCVVEVCVIDDIILVDVSELGALINVVLMGVTEICAADDAILVGAAGICAVDEVVGVAEICTVDEVGVAEICAVDEVGVAETCTVNEVGVAEVCAADITPVGATEVCTADGVILVGMVKTGAERINSLHCYSTG